MTNQGCLLCKSHQDLNFSSCFSAQPAEVFCRIGLENSVLIRPRIPKRCKVVSSPRSSNMDDISHVMMAANGAEFEAGTDLGKSSISA